jgi:hypothetical protein
MESKKKCLNQTQRQVIIDALKNRWDFLVKLKREQGQSLGINSPTYSTLEIEMNLTNKLLAEIEENKIPLTIPIIV